MQQLLLLLGPVGAVWLMVSSKKAVNNRHPPEEMPLSITETLLCWLFCLASPIVSGGILYYGWRKQLPLKARQANRISYFAFGLEVLGITILLIIWPQVGRQLL
jgi:hypothetical protein